MELTLIEIAQLTQPDDTPGSGRRPRRLKSLFKQLIREAQPVMKPAPQVAAAVMKKDEQEQNQQSLPQFRVPSSTTSKAAVPGAQPRVSLSSISMSFNNLRNQSRPQKMQILPGTPGVEMKKDEQALFTQDDLEMQWMSMCNRMPQRLSGIADRMKNMIPTIVQMPAEEVVVPNEIVRDEMEHIKGSIISTLKLYLRNNAITLSLRVAEASEREKILTRREEFELMCHQNPAMEKLLQTFDLVLA